MKTPEELLDIDGYPTEEYLDFIRGYDFLFEDVRPFLDILRDGWAYRDWGFKFRRKYKDHQTLELHTAGWSGNEEVIGALKETYFFTLYWEKTHRGGHYYFKIPIKNGGNR